jgi:twinkle protein
MSKMIEDLQAQQIKLKTHVPGSHKTTCPRCSHTRKNKKDPCLWVNIKDDGLALWKCHNCMWTGSAGNHHQSGGDHQPQRTYKKPAAAPKAAAMPDPVTEFFKKRCITGEVVARNKVYTHAEKKNVVCFPYYLNGELINCKYRSLDKKFYMEKGAKLTFYGMDDVKDAKEIIIVEGEMDKLALEVCGYKNVISVPNGAPAKRSAPDKIDNKGQFEYLIHAEDVLNQAEKIIIAVDNDEPGKNLQWELARRIGAEKCWIVDWPEANKDANGTLIDLGVDLVLDCINDAKPHPIKGLYRVDDFKDALHHFYNRSMERGALTGWQNLDNYYTVMPGELSIVTGIPNSGKSEWIDALMVNLAKNDSWSFAIFSAENSKEQHVTKLTEKIMQKPTDPKSNYRMSWDEYMQGASWVDQYFYFMVSEDLDDMPTIDWILDKAKAAVLRYGIKGLVIDPYNEIEHRMEKGMQETQYISLMLSKLKKFAKTYGVHIWMVAHPAKLQQDKNGNIISPSMYDISGSANWVNKADCGIVVHRSDDASQQTEIHIKKVRFKHVGKKGVCNLEYDTFTGLYSVPKSEKKDDDNDSLTFEL